MQHTCWRRLTVGIAFFLTPALVGACSPDTLVEGINVVHRGGAMEKIVPDPFMAAVGCSRLPAGQSPNSQGVAVRGADNTAMSFACDGVPLDSVKVAARRYNDALGDAEGPHIQAQGYYIYLPLGSQDYCTYHGYVDTDTNLWYYADYNGFDCFTVTSYLPFWEPYFDNAQEPSGGGGGGIISGVLPAGVSANPVVGLVPVPDTACKHNADPIPSVLPSLTLPAGVLAGAGPMQDLDIQAKLFDLGTRGSAPGQSELGGVILVHEGRYSFVETPNIYTDICSYGTSNRYLPQQDYYIAAYVHTHPPEGTPLNATNCPTQPAGAAATGPSDSDRVVADLNASFSNTNYVVQKYAATQVLGIQRYGTDSSGRYLDPDIWTQSTANSGASRQI